MHVNGKIIPVKSTPRIERAGKKNCRGDEFKYDIFDTL
jgi:hypothetical protein